jgi:hypothetical protein
MNRLIRYFSMLLTGSILLMACKVKDYPSTSRPVSHEKWDGLVQQHVRENGFVDYKGFIRDSIQLKGYLEVLEGSHPNDKFWSREERLAYWINAYNAYTVKLIVDHYPVGSIKEIKNGIPFVNTVWDIKFIHIEERTYDLNNIEHGILRAKYDEPRIHFAVNCASVSCPNLRNEAYTAEQLDRQLDDQARDFLSDPTKNIIEPGRVRLSKIFRWYKGDFTERGSLIDFLNRYAPVEIQPDAKVDYLDYNWSLNDLPEDGEKMKNEKREMPPPPQNPRG